MNPQGVRRWRWIRVRVALLAALLVVGAGFVLHRAWELSMQHGEGLRAMAESQHIRSVRLAPRRGTIFDRDGAELAVSVDTESIYANPRLMRTERVDTVLVARRLHEILGVNEETVTSRLRRDRFFVWIKRQVTPAQAQAVRDLNVPGLDMTSEARRYYPNRELASHVLGFANVDGLGIAGVELEMEERLRGSFEPVRVLRDRRGRTVFSERLLDDRAVQGDDLYLTIDKTIQHVAEHELALAVQTFEARAGSVVVMDPRNGEIFAMANYPTFNPNDPGLQPVAHRRNRALTDRFEPGSTVKPFTVGAALAAGVVSPEQPIDCEGGRMQIGEDDQITDDHHFDILTPSEILMHSSNIGTAKIGIALGRRGLYRAFRRFGFGSTTGIELPGETSGRLRHHRSWYDLDLATVSFGQGVSVNTLQLASAMAAVANQGRLMHPTIVRRIVDSRGETVQEHLPRMRRRVLPARTAHLISEMLTSVTGQGGTGTEAAIDGYLVAGKTGTAQKADYVHGGYADGLYTASFVGFVPAQSPRLVIAVVIDEPMQSIYGGRVAAPVFRRVGLAALRHLGVAAESGGEVLEELERRQRRRRRQAREAGTRPAVVVQDRAPADALPTPTRMPRDNEVFVPDARGQSARQAIVMVRHAGLSVRLRGSGRVTLQEPIPGALVERGTEVDLTLERPPLHNDEGPTDTTSEETPQHAQPVPGARPAGTLAAVNLTRTSTELTR